MKHRPPLWSMQKMSLPSVRISESISNPRPSTHSRRLFSRLALGITGMHDWTVILVSLRHNGVGPPATNQLAVATYDARSLPNGAVQGWHHELVKGDAKSPPAETTFHVARRRPVAESAAAAASLCLACQGGPIDRPIACRKASMSSWPSAAPASRNTCSRSYQ